MGNRTVKWPHRPVPVLFTCLGLVVAYGAVSIAVTLLIPGHNIVVGSMVANLLVAVVLLVLRRTTALPRGDRAPVQPTGSLVAVVLSGLVVIWLFGQTLAQTLYQALGSENFQSHQQNMAKYPVLLVLLATTIFSPLGEEALMRGMVYPLYRRSFGVLNAAITTSVVFALMHGNLVQAALAVPLGVFLALVYEITQKVSVVVLLHMLFNLASVLTPSSLVRDLAQVPVISGAGIAVVLVLANLYQYTRASTAQTVKDKV